MSDFKNYPCDDKLNDANDIEKIIRTSGEILLHSQSWQRKDRWKSVLNIASSETTNPEQPVLAAQLQKTFNAETSLIKGVGGDFNVYVDSVLIFSKKKEGRFPNEGEVERLIKKQIWSGFLS